MIGMGSLAAGIAAGVKSAVSKAAKAAEKTNGSSTKTAAGGSGGGNGGANAGSAGTSGGYSAADAARMNQLSAAYATARAAGNAAGMRNANDEANQIRNKYGESAQLANADIAKVAGQNQGTSTGGTSAAGSRLDGYQAPSNAGVLREGYEDLRRQTEAAADANTQRSLLALAQQAEAAQQDYATQQNAVNAEEAQNQDRTALYNRAQGNRGGIGTAQYTAVMNTAGQNRAAIAAAQQKLATDTARAMETLRAQGEYEKAQAVLELGQQELSALYNEYARVDGVNLSVQQYLDSFEVQMASLLGTYQGKETMQGKQLAMAQREYEDQKAETDQAAAKAGAQLLLSAGVYDLSDEQCAALGLSREQVKKLGQVYAAQEAAVRSASGGSRSGSSSGGNTDGSYDEGAGAIYRWLGQNGAVDQGTAYELLLRMGYSNTEAKALADYFDEHAAEYTGAGSGLAQEDFWVRTVRRMLALNGAEEAEQFLLQRVDQGVITRNQASYVLQKAQNG